MNTCETCKLVFDEEKNEIKFESNFGRDEFIKSILESVDNKLTNDGMSKKMIRHDVENETGDSHMVTVVTEDMYHLINLMNDYNLTWGTVYNIVKERFEDER